MEKCVTEFNQSRYEQDLIMLAGSQGDISLIDIIETKQQILEESVFWGLNIRKLFFLIIK